MPRLFTGLKLPDAVRERLAGVRAPLPGAHWVAPENLHITLRFYGDVDNLVAREIDDYLSRAAHNSFELRLHGLGTFGGGEPRSLWAGVESNPLLDMLAGTCERAARVAGLPPERRTFKPHVTLARFRHPRIEPIARFLQRNGGFKTDPFEITKVILFSSKPKTGGGPYVEEQNYTLGDQDWSEDDERSFADKEGRDEWYRS